MLADSESLEIGGFTFPPFDGWDLNFKSLGFPNILHIFKKWRFNEIQYIDLKFEIVTIWNLQTFENSLHFRICKFFCKI